MEADHEAEGLRFWDGDPTVRLIEHDEESGAILMERCEPGSPLRALPENEQDIVIASLLRRMWRVPQRPHPFRSLAVMLEHWSEEARCPRSELTTAPSRSRLSNTWASNARASNARASDARASNTRASDARAGDAWASNMRVSNMRVSNTLPSRTGTLVSEALSLFRELSVPTSTDVLLATDLHAGNVLRATREPWLAIDPKPFIGDPAYDVTQHLLNCRERLRADPAGTIRRIADLVGLDHERIRLWTFARLALEPESVDLARALRAVH